MAASSLGRTKVFISYSHNRRDSGQLTRLLVHLAYYIHYAETLDVWHDGRIRTSQKWFDEIREAIQSTKVAILLVSADFWASEFIWKHELPLLLEAAERGEIAVFSVLLSPAPFEHTSIGKYQAANPLSKPVNGMTPFRQEELWAKLAEDVNDALQR